MNNSSGHSSISVIGAGVVGLSCALWLLEKGFTVTLIDPEEPGSGTSSGNACTIAEYGCIPVNSPDLFKQLPSLMVSRDSPLSINPLYALSHPLWMLEFLGNCRAHRVQHIIDSLGGLLARTWDGLSPLLDIAGARDLLEDRGFMHVFEHQQDFDQAWPNNKIRREQGARLREISAEEIRELEPNLTKSFVRGLYFEGIHQVLDPLALCKRYADSFQQQGGQLLRAKVTDVREKPDGVQLSFDNAPHINTDKVVIAAGAFTRFIHGLGSVSRKLDTERGYHVLFQNQQQLLSRPVYWHGSGFYATPMNLGLRVAGTVEIAGYNAKQNTRITDYLARKVGEMLELPETPDSTWLGFRPTFPDSLPAIGYAEGSRRLLFATGHHHLGLTLSAITGRIVAELANDEEPTHDVAPFSPGRFQR